MNGLQLLGTGRCLPSRRVTNEDFARTLDTSDAWITERTGIGSGISVPRGNRCLSGGWRPGRRWRMPSPGRLACVLRPPLPLTGTPPWPAGAGRWGCPDRPVPGHKRRLHRFCGRAGNRPLSAAGRPAAGPMPWCWGRKRSAACWISPTAAPACCSGTERVRPWCGWIRRPPGRRCSAPGATAGAARRRGRPLSPWMAGVFRFAVETVPVCIRAVLDKAGLTLDAVDHLVCTRQTAASSTASPKSWNRPRPGFTRICSGMATPRRPASPRAGRNAPGGAAVPGPDGALRGIRCGAYLGRRAAAGINKEELCVWINPGNQIPFIQGGMANIATGEFAAAVSNAGALGLIGAGGNGRRDPAQPHPPLPAADR